MELIFFVLIGVGAFLLVAVTAAGIVFLVLWRRRKQSSQAATVGGELPNYTLLSAAPMKSAGNMPSSLLSDEMKPKKAAVQAAKTMWLPGFNTKGAPSAISTIKQPKACIYGVAVPKTVWVSRSKTKGASAISATKQPKVSISGVQVPKAVSMAEKESNKRNSN